MRKLALTLVFGALFVGAFAQTSDPVAALNEVVAIQTKALSDARAQNKPYDAVGTAAAMKAKATEALTGVDVEKVDPMQWSAWSRLFTMAERTKDACRICERYLAANGNAPDAHRARMTMASSCFALGEDHMLAMVLKETKPVGMDALGFGSTVAYYSELIEEKQGAEAALKLIEELESRASYPTVDEYSQTILAQMKAQQKENFKEDEAKPLARSRAMGSIDAAKWAFVERKSELLGTLGRKDEGKAMAKKFIDSLDAASTVRRTADGAMKRMELPGMMAPALSIERGYGGFEGLEKLKGKVVIVDFFAHWCGPCIASFPDMKKLYSDFKGQGLEIVGVTTYYGYYKQERELSKDAEFAKMGDFIKDYDLPWPVAYGPRENFSAYGVTGIPHVAVIDKEGKVHHMKVGYSAASFAKFREDIEKLLKG